ncbi:chondroitinase-B domain-containing protein [Oceanihabitans sp. 2_MG-2023]|uniref:chondroitinase-B domain-containing protein n=1 Tax=Oceanihabitans sp. 2_MG-2023 TaxID=3062661 RepID=UPI0026E1982D|nr:chondroitinase-B domain-containing protein [Oceanihabitans sp. 2_MG-2023]MDO6597988.1 chondroitinase-B domain-containing protein [Oceanihabitans sp. 2_MG-2023]
MKNIIQLTFITLFLFACNSDLKTKKNLVTDFNTLEKAINSAIAGDEIVLKNGVWKNAAIHFYGNGTKEKPITLRAETPGKVILEGQSFLHLGGQHLIVDGLYFKNGYAPESIIRFKINEDSVAFNTRVTNTVIKDFTKPNRSTNDRWIEFYGKNNTLDHCYISGKSNDGETLRVFFTGNQHINTNHQIVNNYFGPRPRKGGPRAETIRVGDSKTRVSPGYVNVSNNYFDACNGEVEIISDKTNFNSYTNNIFYKCEGSLVLRHGSYATVNANIFIGGDDSNFYGGIRAINTGHWITNNYFYKIKGQAFRSPLAIMNGIPMTPLNRYKQVTDIVVAHNTWVDCKSPIQIGVGQNIASANVLPKSEIRSAPPIRSTIANNLIYNTEEDKTPFINHDNMEGILFKNNSIDNNGIAYTEYAILQSKKIKIKQLNDWLFVPTEVKNESLDSVFNGYNFAKIKEDVFGASRVKKSKIGAINDLATAEKFKIDKSKYGPKWFSKEKEISKTKTFTASSKEGDLAKTIAQASSGDIIELNNEEKYIINHSLQIDKEITIQSKGTNKVPLIFKGADNTPVFLMHPNGNLNLNNISLQGQKNQLAFAPLDKNMASAYNLNIDNCIINGFNYALKATKGSFADRLHFNHTSIQNCENGFVLAADIKGDYNAEMVTFNACEFNNVQQNVIHFYRGGYDESTIGGNLIINNNTFIACGKKEKSDILIKTTGIINVHIKDNTFQNNLVKSIAILWGIKNNHHSNNKCINSGEIKVVEQQKQDILY